MHELVCGFSNVNKICDFIFLKTVLMGIRNIFENLCQQTVLVFSLLNYQ
jgi:hypothetical protein